MTWGGNQIKFACFGSTFLGRHCSFAVCLPTFLSMKRVLALLKHLPGDGPAGSQNAKVVDKQKIEALVKGAVKDDEASSAHDWKVTNAPDGSQSTSVGHVLGACANVCFTLPLLLPVCVPSLQSLL
jgi:hypothetical protein